MSMDGFEGFPFNFRQFMDARRMMEREPFSGMHSRLPMPMPMPLQVPFEKTFRCYSASFIDKPELENGNKVIMPLSTLRQLASQMDNPLQFELYNASTNRKSHCGVSEFTAEEGTIYMPYWMMQNMLLEEGDMVKVKMATLPKGTFLKLRPHSSDFLEISDPKAVLEMLLRNFSCISEGDTICISYNNKYFHIDIMETRPSAAVSLIDTDCEVEIVRPLDYKVPAQGFAANTNPSKENKRGDSNQNFKPFNGTGKQATGKTKAASTTEVPLQTKIGERNTPNLKGQRPTSTRKPYENVKSISDATNDVWKDSKTEMNKDKATNEAPKFQPFTGRKYSLNG